MCAFAASFRVLKRSALSILVGDVPSGPFPAILRVALRQRELLEKKQQEEIEEQRKAFEALEKEKKEKEKKRSSQSQDEVL